MSGHFQLPLNLPHAGKVARRLVQVLENRGWADRSEGVALMDCAGRLSILLSPHYEAGENPRPGEAGKVRDEAADLARELVDHIERAGAQDDRVGQCVRNLFECLELGREGAEISLRAGEHPDSAQRP